MDDRSLSETLRAVRAVALGLVLGVMMREMARRQRIRSRREA